MPEAVTAIPKKTVGMETFQSFENVARWIKISLRVSKRNVLSKNLQQSRLGTPRKLGKGERERRGEREDSQAYAEQSYWSKTKQRT